MERRGANRCDPWEHSIGAAATKRFRRFGSQEDLAKMFRSFAGAAQRRGAERPSFFCAHGRRVILAFRPRGGYLELNAGLQSENRAF